MHHSLLVQIPESGDLGLMIGRFVQREVANGGGEASSYLVLWREKGDLTIERQLKTQFVAGSMSHAAVAFADIWSNSPNPNPQRLITEILAEESLIATDGRFSTSPVPWSKIRSRWKAVTGKDLEDEFFEQNVENLESEGLVHGLEGRVKFKLRSEPILVFEQIGKTGWWDQEPYTSITKSFEKAKDLLTKRFYDWHKDLSKLDFENEDFNSFIEFCKQTELVVKEQSIEPNGDTSSSRAFAEYLSSLSGSARTSAKTALALVWGDFSNLQIDSSEATKLLETIAITELREFRVLGNLVRGLMDKTQSAKMSPEEILVVASMACESSIAVNFRDQLETALETVPSDIWATLARSKTKKLSPILDYLGFQSGLGRKLLASLSSVNEDLFASPIFWAALRSQSLNSEVIASLSRPLVSESMRPFVIQALADCLNESSLTSVALAFEDPLVTKAFDSETWARWISKALKSGDIEQGSLVYSILTNEDQFRGLSAQVDSLVEQESLLREENQAQRKALEVSKNEVANLVLQVEQARVGMKASVDSQSEQQTRDVMRSLTKLLVTAGSLPDKVDHSVYVQMVQQVKAIGIVPIGVVGEEVTFDPTRHIAPPGTGVSSGDLVTVIAPGFENRMRDGGEVIWKAQVVLK